MIQHHKYSLTELEAMLPWERDIYVSMLIGYIEEENEKLKMEQATYKYLILIYQLRLLEYRVPRLLFHQEIKL